MPILHKDVKAYKDYLYYTDWNKEHNFLSSLDRYLVRAVAANSYIGEQVSDGAEISSGSDFGAIVNAILLDAQTKGKAACIGVQPSEFPYIATTQITDSALSTLASWSLYGQHVYGEAGEAKKLVCIKPQFADGYLFALGYNWARASIENLLIIGDNASYTSRFLKVVNNAKDVAVRIRNITGYGNYCGRFLLNQFKCYNSKFSDITWYNRANESSIWINETGTGNSNTLFFDNSFFWNVNGGSCLHVQNTAQMRACLFQGNAGFIGAAGSTLIDLDDADIEALTLQSLWFEDAATAIDLAGMTGGGPINVIGCYFYGITSARYNNPNNITINEMGNAP